MVTRGYGRGPCQTGQLLTCADFLFLAGVIRGRRVIHSVPVDDLTSRFGVACVTHQLTGVILDEICAGDFLHLQYIHFNPLHPYGWIKVNATMADTLLWH